MVFNESSTATSAHLGSQSQGEGVPTSSLSKMTLDGPREFGKGLRDEFCFDPEWRNMNNGSFGSTPRVIKEKQFALQLRAEAVPDLYTRYEYPVHLDEARAALAAHLNAPVETIVLVANATTAVNVVLHNLVWDPSGRDEIISFSTVYGGCGKTIDYITDTKPLVAQRVIELRYPADTDAAIVQRFRATVAAARAAGRTPRLALFDTVSSLPGVRFPYEAVTRACRDLGVLSLVDGAQGVGMMPLDLAALDADFVLSNCHKWLHVPRGCAFLYVPLRNQHLLPSTLPTSHGYAGKSAFEDNFQVLGGEERIVAYLWQLAKEGGRRAAEILGTDIIENDAGTLTNCGLVNVWLPVRTADGEGDGAVVSAAETAQALAWAQKWLVEEKKTAQVYLDMEDFEWAAHRLKEVSEEISKGAFK
ncbi:Hercynylcysteine sulfoxide lyase like protein [Verticillium longisporum]|uniref:Hercynylcysteine sulfoxide lyase like protein n=1 Tax=Verticillium longisporum TaxID=100787 RepID=A0A8I3AHW5_VERLO|nr:Hercynylcysteine sulfoxide lyase like protein [Verticillium longisporum]